jgi:hypothetical protein
MAMTNMWCFVCASNVKVVDKLSFCFGAFEYLWQWWVWWVFLVEIFKEWVDNGENKRLIEQC